MNQPSKVKPQAVVIVTNIQIKRQTNKNICASTFNQSQNAAS